MTNIKHIPTAHGKPYNRPCNMYHYCSTQSPSHRMANWWEMKMSLL